MTGDNAYWMLLAGAVLSRWLFSWAQTSTKLWFGTGICATALLWLAAPVLANFGSVELEYWLLSYGKVIAILVCIEAWIVGTVFTSYSYLSPVSWASLLYIQALLFQSGYIPFSFDAQSLLIAGVILVIGLLLHRVAIPRVNFANHNRIHLAVLWLVTWFGFCTWPDDTGIQTSQHLRDSTLLIAVVPLATLFSVFSSICWARLNRHFQGI